VGETPTLLGPLERANLQVQWLREALSKEPNRAGVSFATWKRKYIQFPKRRAVWYLEFGTMDKMQNPVILSLKPFKAEEV
jgi:hypothetical protein